MIECKGKVKGEKKEYKGKFVVNSGSDVVLLPRKIAEIIAPKLVGEGELILADGSRVKRLIYEVMVEITDSKGKVKSCNAYATIEEREDVVISIEVLEKLGAIIDVRERKILFKD
jgi:predicted aspartyl protease